MAYLKKNLSAFRFPSISRMVGLVVLFCLSHFCFSFPSASTCMNFYMHINLKNGVSALIFWPKISKENASNICWVPSVQNNWWVFFRGCISKEEHFDLCFVFGLVCFLFFFFLNLFCEISGVVGFFFLGGGVGGFFLFCFSFFSGGFIFVF